MDLSTFSWKFLWFSNANFLGSNFYYFLLLFFNKHVFGIHIQHVGDNSVSAEQMGINVNAVKIKAFMFVGVGSAIGGIFTTMITYTFFPTQGFGYCC